MANKIETSSKNIKPKINLNHNIHMERPTHKILFQIEIPQARFLYNHPYSPKIVSEEWKSSKKQNPA